MEIVENSIMKHKRYICMLDTTLRLQQQLNPVSHYLTTTKPNTYIRAKIYLKMNRLTLSKAQYQ